jgi:hypothetical protein
MKEFSSEPILGLFLEKSGSCFLFYIELFTSGDLDLSFDKGGKLF